MNLKDMQPTYTMRDMVKMIRRVDQLTRENTVLNKQMEALRAELEQVRAENEDLTDQLDEMQADFARQMTAPVLLAKQGKFDA
jgi:cell division protein FtsB